jgi:hypothetical protein
LLPTEVLIGPDLGQRPDVIIGDLDSYQPTGEVQNFTIPIRKPTTWKKHSLCP